VNNTGLNPDPAATPPNPGYAVFGKVANAASLATMDRISARDIVDAHTDPKFAAFAGILAQLPIRNKVAFDARGTPGHANLDPNADVIKITRVAMKMGVAQTAV